MRKFENIALCPNYDVISEVKTRDTNREAGVQKSTPTYVRTFDVISDVNCVLLRKKRIFENIALCPNYDVISEVKTRFTNREAGVQKSTPTYVRTFDVISEANCVLLRKKRKFENIALCPNYDVISDVKTRFTNREAGVQKSTPTYVRTFDVISEANCVLLRKKRKFENIALCPNYDVISEVKTRFTNREPGVQKSTPTYVRTFDVISEVNCVPLRKKRVFENIALCLNYDVISEVKTRSTNREAGVQKKHSHLCPNAWRYI